MKMLGVIMVMAGSLALYLVLSGKKLSAVIPRGATGVTKTW